MTARKTTRKTTPTALDDMMAAYAKHRAALEAAKTGGNNALIANTRLALIRDLEPALEELHQALTTKDAA